MIKTVEMDFEYQNVIAGPPKSQSEMYAQACSNDRITLDSWRDIWIDYAQKNHKTHGPFKDKSAGVCYDKYRRQPVIVAGSGPSLKANIKELADTKGIPIVSCLHNYHLMIDNNVQNIEGFVSLDAGDVVVEEIYEGGKKDKDYYFDSTKDHTLYTFISSPPKLLDLWKGDIRFFSAPTPDPTINKAFKDVEPFDLYISSGGNVLGACVYLAKAFMGGNPIAFVGADFSFSYTKKFHGWDSKYDKNMGNCLRAQDVWGNKVLTWQSYFNFKVFFDWLSTTVPGLYVNCSEGGILGAYPEGNIGQIMQMELSKLIRMYSLNEDMKEQCAHPEIESNRILY